MPTSRQRQERRQERRQPQRQPRQRVRHDISELLAQITYAGLPVPERELRFAWVALHRAWRLDLAWPLAMVGVEVDGATWAGGRHVTGSGYEADCEKLNAAVLLGWRVLRFTYGQVTSGYALATIERALAAQPTTETERASQ